jgi:hypothetical protein
VTGPLDARLPGGGGQEFCGLADISPALVSSVDNLVTQASHYGKRTDVFDGIDIALAARFGRGGQLNGGVSLGRTVTDTGAVIESPQEARPDFCRTTLSWWQGQGQAKFNAIYPLPWWGLQASGTYQNLAGVPHVCDRGLHERADSAVLEAQPVYRCQRHRHDSRHRTQHLVRGSQAAD